LAAEHEIVLTEVQISVFKRHVAGVVCSTRYMPLSKAPYLPGRCEWLPTAPVCGICLYECVTLCMCMCMSTGANLDGLKAEDKFHVYACMHDNKSDLNLLKCNCWLTPPVSSPPYLFICSTNHFKNDHSYN